MNLYELAGRLLLLTVSILILYYTSNKKDTESINPLIIIVGYCTFSLCYLFTQIELGVEIGFGLFAIFSILRFRAQTFPLNAVVFLFAIITLSILDALFPVKNYEILIFLQIIVIGFYITAVFFVEKHTNNKLKTISLILGMSNSFKLQEEYIREVVKSKINIEKFEYKITDINTITNEVNIKVIY